MHGSQMYMNVDILHLIGGNRCVFKICITYTIQPASIWDDDPLQEAEGAKPKCAESFEKPSKSGDYAAIAVQCGLG